MKIQNYFALLSCLIFCQSLFAQSPSPCSPGTPPAEDCASACLFCNLNGYASSTAGYTGDGANGFCGSIEVDQWFGFVAGTTDATFIATTTSCTNGDGVQLAIYQDCTGVPLPNGCNGGQQGGEVLPVAVTVQLTPGETYYLMVDGFGGDQCEFTLSVNPPNAIWTQPLDSTIGDITGYASVCPGATTLYTVPEVQNAGAYVWSVPPGWSVNGQPGTTIVPASENGDSVLLTAGSSAGNYPICVRAVNTCNATGTSVCKTIAVVPIAPTILPLVTLCAGESYTLPWGDVVTAPGNYFFIYQSYLDCDSIVQQPVSFRAPILFIWGPQYICQGDCFLLGDSSYCNSGTYVQILNSYQGCDSTVMVNLVVVDPAAAANIQAPQGLGITCLVPELVLQSNTIPNATHLWTNNMGDTLGTGNSILATTAGYYAHNIKIISGNDTCTAQSKVLIKKNTEIPAVTATGGTLSASNPTVQLHGNSIISGVTYSWTGPNGYTSNKKNPIVSMPGFYTLTVTNPATGCSNTVTVEVLLMS